MTSPRVTVILPCFDEARRVPRTISALLAELPDDVSLLVVDDGSRDETAAAALDAARGDPRVQVTSLPANRGKGGAVRAGMLDAQARLLVFTDADGSYGPADVLRVADALRHTPVAIGTRGKAPGGGPLPRQLASRGFNFAVRRMLGLPYTDTQCGLKGFRRDAAQAIFSRARMNGYGFDAEVLFLARRLDLGVTEVAVEPEARSGSKVRIVVDALRMLREMAVVRRLAASGAYDAPAPGLPTAPGSNHTKRSQPTHGPRTNTATPRPNKPAEIVSAIWANWGRRRNTPASSSGNGNSPSSPRGTEKYQADNR
jgi:glycosyltransferase involved in cell wall biosynthesis